MKIEQAALSLYQLLGAPLYALIQAETYAANATADFIERVGFEPPADAADQQTPQDDMGKLRTISFQQERRTADGQAASYKVEVPLLSILPIPSLQIKEAELEFYVKIVDMLTATSAETMPGQPEQLNTSEPAKVTDSETLIGSRLVPTAPRLDMKAMLGRGQPNTPQVANSAFDMQVHMKIKVAQADPPAGLARLFNLMEQSISSTKIEG